MTLPFRREQPDYQRRWRWARSLREIREKSRELTTGLLTSLRALVSRAEQLAERATDAVQTGVLAGEKLARSISAVRATIGAIEQLEASAAELRKLGL